MNEVRNVSPELQSFSIRDIFRNGWELVSGYKATFWGAFFLAALAYLVIWGVFACINYYAIHYVMLNKDSVQYVTSLLQNFLGLPLSVGIFILGIKRVSGLPIRALDVFNFYPYILGLIGVYILQMIIFSILGGLIGLLVVAMMMSHSFLFVICLLGVVALGLFLVYLAVGYSFSMVIRIEKKLGLWNCLETSRRGVTQHWFKIFFMFILSVLLVLLGIIPLLIGLIWVLPWVNLVMGLVYIKLFGPLNPDNLIK